MKRLTLTFGLLLAATAAAHAQVPKDTPNRDPLRDSMLRGDPVKTEETHIINSRSRNKAPDKWYDRPETFKSEIKVRNSSAKAIRFVTWTTTLLDSETGDVIRSYDVTTETRIAPGKSRKLSERLITPPDRVVRANARNPNRPNVADIKVKVATVTYEDGSTSTTP